MLSKSASKSFFIAGTSLCFAAFIGLTVDTFSRIPNQTHSKDITPAVARGKGLWDSNNCMGCHTLFGEGAYYAPELTRVVERRGPEFIRAMLQNPEAMYPGERKMQNYHFAPTQIDDLIAFLEWAGRVDLNGFPPRPTLNAVAVPTQTGAVIARADNRPQVFNQLCVACHSLGGQGGAVGPALDGVGGRYNPDYLERWLHDPQSVRAGTKMPQLPLSNAQIRELSAFLSQLKTSEGEPAPISAPERTP